MNSYGEHFRFTIWGQSHGPAVGVTMEGLPAGFAIDFDELQRFLDRRAPGQAGTTPRKEADRPEFVSGLANGVTCGAPVTALHRVRIGDLPLDEALAPGEFRALTEAEIAAALADT